MGAELEILIVEDEKNIAQSLKKNFLSEGHHSTIAGSGERALELVEELEFDLILLDWRLPGITGFEVCKSLRQSGLNTPVILLTALTDISNKVDALEAGADDYITKPFSFEEVFARAKAVLRRYENSAKQISIRDILIDLIQHEVSNSKSSIKLPEKEFELLKYFVDNKGTILSKEVIAKDLWNFDSTVKTNVVETTLKNLRKKLQGLSGEPFIKNLYGEGYILLVD